jgi:L-methionine (R)-S-oxide reductase
MAKKIKLSEIVDNLDIQSDGIEAFLNKKTGKVVIITEMDRSELEDYDALDEDESEEDFLDDLENGSDEVQDFFEHEEDYLQLPSQDDIHEYDIMADFCDSVKNPQHSSQLKRAIKGSGAFRRFKDLVNDLGIEQQWYRFRNAAFKDIAVEWCEDNQLDYLDDIDIPDEEKLLTGQKAILYAELEKQLRALLESETDLIANTANMAALLYHSLPDINWAGFYFLQGDVLVLGPFQGQPACVRIPLGKGVCGTAAKERKPLVVPDVHEFPGHIACDAASKSEIVLPLIKDDKVLGVLDIDSPIIGRFDEIDREGLEKLVEVLKFPFGVF